MSLVSTLPVERVSLDTWSQFHDDRGQIYDEYSLRKWLFYEGAEPEVRGELWKFLFGYYSFSSTQEGRKGVDADKKAAYNRLVATWNSPCFMPDKAFEDFSKVIEMDSWRTDRHLDYYSAANVEKLQRVLRTFIVYDTEMGYIQGMNDLLSPFLMLMEEEHEAFWCFTDLMKKMSPILSDLSLSQPLCNVSRLCWYVDKQLYDHLESINGAQDWLFCYRWLLLCFKREFTSGQIYELWESIWSNHVTSHFLFVFTMAVLLHFRTQLLLCQTPEDLLQLSCKSSVTIPLHTTLSTARSLILQLKSEEYLPHELRYLVSTDGCAPPPLVGFIRARQRFSTLHSNRIPILENLFGETSFQPVTSPFMLSQGAGEQAGRLGSQHDSLNGTENHILSNGREQRKVNFGVSVDSSACASCVSSTPPPKVGFVPREGDIVFREDIRRLQCHIESTENTNCQCDSLAPNAPRATASLVSSISFPEFPLHDASHISDTHMENTRSHSRLRNGTNFDGSCARSYVDKDAAWSTTFCDSSLEARKSSHVKYVSWDEDTAHFDCLRSEAELMAA